MKKKINVIYQYSMKIQFTKTAFDGSCGNKNSGNLKRSIK
jgi:hypothetical protein